MPLNPKQQRFADQYLIDLNATQAYQKSYKVKSESVAAVNASKLLRNAKVQDYIQKQREKLSSKQELSQEMILEGYRKLAFYDARKFYDSAGNLAKIPDLDDESAFALTGFEIMEEKGGNGQGVQVVLGYTKKIKMSDRRAAMDSICKVLGYFAPDKLDLKLEEGTTIKTSDGTIITI